MNIKSRLQKLEKQITPPIRCFCNKTWIDLMFGGDDDDELTYCPRCKDKFDQWQDITAEAKSGRNLTDEVTI